MPVQGLDLLGEYQYVAIFDADFKPEADFLVSRAAVHLLMLQPSLGLQLGKLLLPS